MMSTYNFNIKFISEVFVEDGDSVAVMIKTSLQQSTGFNVKLSESRSGASATEITKTIAANMSL